jgi:SAM-dependent methyltransferase
LPKKLKVLDYGCGDGVLTTILRKKYGTALGVDYTISSSQSKSPFLFKNYEEFTSDHHYRNYFDIIILRHVLEHTTNPNQFLQDLSVFLSKNGKFIIEVPNFDSPLRKFFGVNYNHLSVPYHQYHFSKKSIKNVLSTFEIIKIVNANVPVLIQSIFNVFDIKISDLGIFTAAGYPLQLLLNIFFADSTAMIVLVKPQKAFDLPN